MNDVGLVNEAKWYTIEDLASLCGISVETLRKGNSPLLKLGIDLKVESKIKNIKGHRNVKFYSENVLKALKEYQIKNSVPNATINKQTYIEGNISAIQTQTVKSAIDNLLDNPETLNMLLTESLARTKALGIENKQLREVLAEKEAVLNKIANGKGCFSMEQTAKALKLPYGRNKLFEKLREMKLLNCDNSPMQEQVNAGHFKIVIKYVNESIGNKSVTLTTGKGLVYLAKKLNTEIDENVKADA